jgi:hypothetical protein
MLCAHIASVIGRCAASRCHDAASAGAASIDATTAVRRSIRLEISVGSSDWLIFASATTSCARALRAASENTRSPTTARSATPMTAITRVRNVRIDIMEYASPKSGARSARCAASLATSSDHWPCPVGLQNPTDAQAGLVTQSY